MPQPISPRKKNRVPKEKPPFDSTPPKNEDDLTYSQYMFLQQGIDTKSQEISVVNADGTKKSYSQYMSEKENLSNLTKQEMDEFIEHVGHSVTIIETRIEGNSYSGGKVAAYRVEVPLLEFAVWRKHTDFFWLRNHLKLKYPGMFIPYLLPKLKISPTQSIAHKRSFLFISFLEEIGSHEILRHDEATLTFLGEKDIYTWTEFMKNNENVQEKKDWLGESKNIDLNESENMINNHKQMLVIHEKHLTKLQESVKKLARASHSVRKSVNKCSKVAKAYSTATATNSNSGDGGAGGDDDEKNKSKKYSNVISKALGSMANALGSWGTKSALEPAVLSDVLAPQITFQLRQVTAFRELMAIRENVLSELDKKKKKLQSHENAKSSGKKQRRGSVFSMTSQKEDIDDAIINETNSIKEIEEKILYLTRCLVESEMEKYESTRTSHYQNIVGLMALGMLKVQDDVSNVWESANESSDKITEQIKLFIPHFDDFGDQQEDMDDVDEE
jgi:hypothetical protein